MNGWGFILDQSLATFSKTGTINNYKYRCGLVLEERKKLSNPYSSWLGVGLEYCQVFPPDILVKPLQYPQTPLLSQVF